MLKRRICLAGAVTFLCLAAGFFGQCHAEDKGGQSPREVSLVGEIPCEWERLGMDGGGAILDVVISPHNPDTVFCLSDKGGVHRSDDGGLTWRMCNRGFTRETFYGVADLVVHPEDPNVLLATTGNAGWAYRHWCPGGVFRSEDGGGTWNLTARLPFCGESTPGKGWGNRLCLDPDNADIVYAATYDKGLFKSTDGGKTWKYLALGDRFLTGILVDPEEHERLLATAWELPIDTSRKGGLLESLDGGDTWRVVWEHPDLVSLQRAPFNHDWLVAAVGADGIKLSRDRGATWTDIPCPAPMRQIRLAKFQPGHDSRLYALSGGEGSMLFFSDDFGGTWTKAVTDFKTQLSYPDDWYHSARKWAPFTSQSGLHDIEFDERVPGRIFASDYFSVWRSDDDGKTYATHPKGISSLCVYQIVPDPKEEGVIYVNTADIGLLKSTDDGKTFQWPFADDRNGAGDTLINEASMLLISPDDNRLMAIDVTVEWKKPKFSTVMMSTDGGAHWRTRGRGIPQGTYVTGMAALSPDLEQLLVVAGNTATGEDDVYFSPSSDAPFTRFAPGLPNEGQRLYGNSFGCLPNLALGASCVYTVTLKGMYRCPLAAEEKAWERLPFFGDNTTFRTLVTSSAAPKSVWVGTGNGVYASHDEGETWQLISAPCMQECRGIAVDGNNPRRIAVAVASPWWVSGENKCGIYLTEDGGGAWRRLSDMPGEGMAWRLAMDPKDSRILYVGTNGIAGWRTRVP